MKHFVAKKSQQRDNKSKVLTKQVESRGSSVFFEDCVKSRGWEELVRNSDTLTQDPSDNISLGDQLEQLLVPLLKFCLRHQLRLSHLEEAAKRLFVELARKELQHLGEQMSASRISLMTGVHRKDTTRLLSPIQERGRERDLLTKIIGQWRHHSNFSDGAGNPRPLSGRGAESEFGELVRSITREMSPYAIAFELERRGVIRERNDKIELVSAEFTHHNTAEAFSMLSQDIDDLIRAVEENIEERDLVPNAHLTTEYDSIPESAITEVRAWILDHAAEFHERVRTFLSEHESRDQSENSETRSFRVSVGTFSRCEELLLTSTSSDKNKEKQ